MRRIANAARGFTLIEIIVSIVAIGILMTLVTAVFAPEVVRGTDPLYSMRATELGQSYLEEMLGKRFDENSPLGNSQRCGAPAIPPQSPILCSATLGIDAGETSGVTNTFDDVDDYATINNAAPIDQSGAVRSGYENFRVSITVTDAAAELTLPNDSAKRVDITITDPRSNQYKFTAYKTNF